MREKFWTYQVIYIHHIYIPQEPFPTQADNADGEGTGRILQRLVWRVSDKQNTPISLHAYISLTLSAPLSDGSPAGKSGRLPARSGGSRSSGTPSLPGEEVPLERLPLAAFRGTHRQGATPGPSLGRARRAGKAGSSLREETHRGGEPLYMLHI